MAKVKHKVGDIVEIQSKTTEHGFEVGDKVRILEVKDGDYDYKAELEEGGDFFWINESDLKKDDNE